MRVALGEGLEDGGVHQSGVWVKEDTPYLVYPVGVPLEASPRTLTAAILAHDHQRFAAT